MAVGALVGPSPAAELERSDREDRLTATTQTSETFDLIDTMAKEHADLCRGVEGDPTPRYFAFRVNDLVRGRKVTVREFIDQSGRTIERHVRIQKPRSDRLYTLKVDGRGFEIPPSDKRGLKRLAEVIGVNLAYRQFIESMRSAKAELRARDEAKARADALIRRTGGQLIVRSVAPENLNFESQISFAR